jgi:hypothetical protein
MGVVCFGSFAGLISTALIRITGRLPHRPVSGYHLGNQHCRTGGCEVSCEDKVEASVHSLRLLG